MTNPRAVLAESQTHRADWAVERNAADHERGRGRVDRQHVVRVALVGADDGDYDLSLVAVSVRKRWAQWAVREAAGENRLLARTTFAAEKRAGNFACRVGTLFDVDCQREEVDTVAHALGRVSGGEHCGLADSGNYRALRLQSKLACLECECFLGAANWPRD